MRGRHCPGDRTNPSSCRPRRQEFPMRLRSLTMSVLALLAAAPAALTVRTAAAEGPMKQSFGTTTDGHPVDRYTLTNQHGMEADIITRGAIVTRLMVPDKAGKPGDVVLGFDTLDGYLKENPYFGAIVGRYGNRIAKGRFTLNGKEYKLAVNNGENALHGGLKGFDKVVWTAKEINDAAGPAVELTYVSKDAEEGYPGTLTTTVRYTLTPSNELRLDYNLQADRKTVANVTNHSYFNLSGEGSGDILRHRIQINADRF